MKKPRQKGNGRVPPIYKSYVFRDKDPVIDQVRTLVNDTYGEVNRKTLFEIQEAGGPKLSCMARWFFGDTKRPQSATIEAAGRAMGYERGWRKIKG